jgi:hypothetical protein
MAFEDVEKIVFRGDPSDVWLKSIEEDDIVEYLGRRPPAEFHPDVIPLICRFPFQQRENQLFVCQRFLKLLLYSEKFLCSHRDRTDVLVFVAGFMEASGYTAALGQLIFHRNLFLKQGFEETSSEVLALNHAIGNLYGIKFGPGAVVSL